MLVICIHEYNQIYQHINKNSMNNSHKFPKKNQVYKII